MDTSVGALVLPLADLVGRAAFVLISAVVVATDGMDLPVGGCQAASSVKSKQRKPACCVDISVLQQCNDHMTTHCLHYVASFLYRLAQHMQSTVPAAGLLGVSTSARDREQTHGV